MKKVIIILLVFFINKEIKAQTVINPVWIKTEVGSANNRAEGWGLDVDEFGNVYWAVNANNLIQRLDITCYKYNPNGEELWSTPFFYGGLGDQQAFIINASDTSLYIGGKICPLAGNSCDMLLLKVDKNIGSLIWDRTMNFSGNGYDELDGLELKNDGIYCSGWAHELEAGIFFPDMGFWKLDYNGNTIWTNYFGKSGSGEHQDGHLVVDDNFIYAAGLWDGGSNGNAYNGSSFLGKFDKSNGVFIDSTLFGSQSNNFLDAENALGMTSHGDYLYVTGYTTPVAASDWQIFVAKYDKDLNQSWFKTWGGEGIESARGIAVVDDIIYVAGQSSSPSIMSGGDRDAVLLMLDTSGNVLSYQTWGDTLQNSFLDVYADGNSIYLTGTTIIDANSGQRSAHLLKVSNIMTSIEDGVVDNNLSFNVYPNPSHGDLKILFNNKTHERGNLIITDINGRLVSKMTFRENENTINLTIEKLGVFFITIDNGKYRITKKIINN